MKLNWKLKGGRDTNQIAILDESIDFFGTTHFLSHKSFIT